MGEEVVYCIGKKTTGYLRVIYLATEQFGQPGFTCLRIMNTSDLGLQLRGCKGLSFSKWFQQVLLSGIQIILHVLLLVIELLGTTMTICLVFFQSCSHKALIVNSILQR